MPIEAKDYLSHKVRDARFNNKSTQDTGDMEHMHKSWRSNGWMIMIDEIKSG